MSDNCFMCKAPRVDPKTIPDKLLYLLRKYVDFSGATPPNAEPMERNTETEAEIKKLAAQVAGIDAIPPGELLRRQLKVETKPCAYELCDKMITGAKQRLYCDNGGKCKRYQSQIKRGLGKDNKPLKK